LIYIDCKRISSINDAETFDEKHIKLEVINAAVLNASNQYPLCSLPKLFQVEQTQFGEQG